MTQRVLSRDEYAQLAGTELETIWPHLTEGAQVLVVEDDGVIVGCWAVLNVKHCEGIFIAPAYRQQGAVARRLLTGMRQLVRDSGARTFVTSALTEEIADLARRIGGHELIGTHFVVGV